MNRDMDEEFAQLDRRLSGVSDRRTDLFHLIGNHKEMRRRGTNGKEVEKEIRRLDKAETKILRSFYKDREFWQDMCKEMDDDIARLEPQLRNPIVEYLLLLPLVIFATFTIVLTPFIKCNLGLFISLTIVPKTSTLKV